MPLLISGCKGALRKGHPGPHKAEDSSPHSRPSLIHKLAFGTQVILFFGSHAEPGPPSEGHSGTPVLVSASCSVLRALWPAAFNLPHSPGEDKFNLKSKFYLRSLKHIKAS